MLGAGVLSDVACLFIVYSVFVLWLGSSFAFFCLAFALEKMQMCYQMRWLNPFKI
jgi:hypothetical protein